MYNSYNSFQPINMQYVGPPQQQAPQFQSPPPPLPPHQPPHQHMQYRGPPPPLPPHQQPIYGPPQPVYNVPMPMPHQPMPSYAPPPPSGVYGPPQPVSLPPHPQSGFASYSERGAPIVGGAPANPYEVIPRYASQQVEAKSNALSGKAEYKKFKAEDHYIHKAEKKKEKYEEKVTKKLAKQSYVPIVSEIRTYDAERRIKNYQHKIDDKADRKIEKKMDKYDHKAGKKMDKYQRKVDKRTEKQLYKLGGPYPYY